MSTLSPDLTASLPTSLSPSLSPSIPTVAADPPKPWRLGTRLAFRWCVAYFGVCYILLTSLGSLSLGLIHPLHSPDSLPPLKNMIEWTAVHVLHATLPLSDNGGSGDKTGDWAEVVLLLTIGTMGAIAWSWLDRARPRYGRVQVWFRWLVSYRLGLAMVSYGATKVIPLQMPAPSLARLLQPYGTFSPMGALWSFMGASPAYEIFAGSIELLAGILLLTPGTTTLGALVALVAMTNVFVLNMTYDVCVKLFSFHLLLMSLVLLAPDAKRLATVILLRRAVPAAPEPPLVRNRLARRILIVAQVLLAVYVVGRAMSYNISSWTVYGSGAPRSPVRGIWTVETMTIDGQPHPPLTTDTTRWHRVIFDRNDVTFIQLMDDTLQRYQTTLDLSKQALTFTKPPDKSWNAHLTLQRPTPTRVTIDGTMDGHVLHTEMTAESLDRLLLMNQPFHWIEETPISK